MSADVKSELAAVFLSRWPGEAPPATAEIPGPASYEAELATQLQVAQAAGEAAWPGLGIPAVALAAYLGERADRGATALDALARLPVTDLYLACACAQGTPAALAAFEAQFLSRLDVVIARIDPAPAFADELKQHLRVMLLVGGEKLETERMPSILQYRGHGPLRGWLAVVATRAALALKRGQNKWADLEEVALLASLDDPDLHHLRGHYLEGLRSGVKQAVSAALAALAPEERNLLRWHLIENVSLRKIAVARGTYTAAVAREYARIRATIIQQVRGAVEAQAGVSGTEAESLLGALMSRISLSMSMLLKDPVAGAPIKPPR